ncbi:MAG: penicillin-binding protein 1A [Vicinamibacterales bacterium]
MRLVVRVARSAVLVILFATVAMAGILSGVLFAYAGDLPEITALDDYRPNTISRVHAANGQVIGEFAVERRLVIPYEDISPRFREAIIAAEDAGFNTHFGLSISAIATRLVRDILDAMKDAMARRLSRPAGASTLTQQLARNLFAEQIGYRLGDTSLERKIKEAIVALQIEKRYTKREILTFYANQVLFGHGTYGVESASRLYFAKSAKDLTLEEAAMLAGIVQTPARQSPFVNIEAATRRRNYVLTRMAEEHYISEADAEAAKKTPIAVKGRLQPPGSIAPYFVEEIRKRLEQRYGADALYESGLSVTTTLDVKMQLSANKAVNHGLRRIDKRRGFRKVTRNVLANGGTLDDFTDPRWTQPIAVGDYVPAVVEVVGKPGPANGARLRIGKYRADLTSDGFAWTRRTKAADLLKPGDLVEVEVTSVDESTGTVGVTLEQRPLVEGALVAIENRTGHIKALVGGWSFDRSKFNRAVQAYRQLGSTFKPIVYTAAIDRGYTPASIIIDAPVAFDAGSGQIYSPQNYDHKFEGPVTLRRALEDSRNIPAVKMMDAVGPANVVGYAKRFGLNEPFQPYLSLALGAGEAPLLEVTSAYTAFPNGGVRMKPMDVLKVMDREGNLLEEPRSQAFDVIRADTAFVMTNILRGVVQHGTGAAALSLKWPLGGKTGTVDDNTDAWFIGFDPDITVGVWTGLDEKKPIGRLETGAQAALPIWMEFMRDYIDARPDKDSPPEFTVPGNIVFVPIHRSTGAAAYGDEGGFSEAFISGTQPGGASASLAFPHD